MKKFLDSIVGRIILLRVIPICLGAIYIFIVYLILGHFNLSSILSTIIAYVLTVLITIAIACLVAFIYMFLVLVLYTLPDAKEEGVNYKEALKELWRSLRD